MRQQALLRAFRKSADMTQQDVANALGVYRETIAVWEKRGTSWENVARYAEATNHNLEEWLEDPERRKDYDDWTAKFRKILASDDQTAANLLRGVILFLES